MKATKYLSLAALALMGTLASCQSDDEAAVSFARPDNAVGINVTVGAMQTTRSNPASTDPDAAHVFNLGDQVCVSTDGQDPVLFQCTNADQQTWAEAEANKFLLWTQNEMTFQAYYPATEGTSMTTFTLPADQSSEEKIALADYMTREQTRTNENGTDINLQLERKMARVIVNIAGFNDQYNNDQKTVSNVRINSQFSAIADGNGTSDITAVTPYAQNGTGGVNTTYTALVVPGDGDSSADFITLTDALNNTLTVKGIPELEVGNSYTFNLTVGKNTIQVQSVTVQDWTNGTTLAGGQAQEQLSVPVISLSGRTYLDDELVIPDGYIVTGYATAYSCKVAVADGATVTLRDVENDNGTLDPGSACPGIRCIGDATIILEGNNTVNGGYMYAGIYVPEGKTLTIRGTGSLTVTGGSHGAGIGGNIEDNCGSIVISGGTITATGGSHGAGIGLGYSYEREFGNITISGGTVTATGYDEAPGIGGRSAYFQNITITDGVTKVTVNKGSESTYSIGTSESDYMEYCGAITIGGTVYLNGGNFENNGDSYLRTSSLVYQP